MTTAAAVQPMDATALYLADARRLARTAALVLLFGLVGQGALVGLWLWTRTIGVPVGAAAGQREPVGVLDATSVVFELVIVACCAGALRPAQGGQRQLRSLRMTELSA